MRRYDQSNVPTRVDADAFQVPQGSWSSITIKAGIDNDPPAIADMQDDALAVARAKNREFEFPFCRRAGLSAGAILRAHSLPACRSPSVILGRSRKTICDTRFRVASGERSYPITQRKILPTAILVASASESSSREMVASSLSCDMSAVKSTSRATNVSSSILTTYPSHSCNARRVTMRDTGTVGGGRLTTWSATPLFQV